MVFKNLYRVCYLAFFLFACLAVLPSAAFAEACLNLDDNPKWVEGLNALGQEIRDENWDLAYISARNLEKICDASPTLNYLLAIVYKNKHDNEKYLFYLQKATQNTERFAVDKDLLDKMWAEKYIVSHPEASPESILAYQSEIESLKSLSRSLKAFNADRVEQMKTYRELMWAGVGMAASGAVLTAAGLAVALVTEPAEFYSGMHRAPDKYRENPLHPLGWSFVGLGASLIIVGTVFASVYGYRDAHFIKNVDFALEFSPLHAAFEMHF